MSDLDAYTMPPGYGETVGRALEFEELEQIAAQLRQVYAHLVAGRVVDQRRFAEGLIGPALDHLEELARIKHAHADLGAGKSVEARRFARSAARRAPPGL